MFCSRTQNRLRSAGSESRTSNHSIPSITLYQPSHCASLFWGVTYQNKQLCFMPQTVLVCEQKRHRKACTSMQSDLQLFHSLDLKHNSNTCQIRNFRILAFAVAGQADVGLNWLRKLGPRLYFFHAQLN